MIIVRWPVFESERASYDFGIFSCSFFAIPSVSPYLSIFKLWGQLFSYLFINNFLFIFHRVLAISPTFVTSGSKYPAQFQSSRLPLSSFLKFWWHQWPSPRQNNTRSPLSAQTKGSLKRYVTLSLFTSLTAYFTLDTDKKLQNIISRKNFHLTSHRLSETRVAFI